MAIGTSIGELSHIIGHIQSIEAVAMGQFARRDCHIARSQAAWLAAVDLCAVNGDGELCGIDDLRRAVGDIVVVGAEGGKAAAICVCACSKLHLIDAFIGSSAIVRGLFCATRCGVQVLAGLGRCFGGGGACLIGPRIGRIAAGRCVRRKI